jgi:hypothetical protein
MRKARREQIVSNLASTKDIDTRSDDDVLARAVAWLDEARQQDEHGCDRDGSSDPSSNLGERHKLHPIGGGENGDVACAALSAVACVNNGRLDRVHAKQSAYKRAGGHQCRHGTGDRDYVGEIEGCHQLIPGRHRNTDGEQERIGHGRGEEFVDHEAPLLQMG